MKKLFAAVILFSLTLAACAAPRDEAQNTAAETTPVETIAAETTVSEITVSETAGEGKFSTFTAYDPDGNEVNGDIFTGYKLTMVNIWGTFCTPCINEMPDLAKLHKDYADKEFQIVGLVADVFSAGKIDEKDARTVKKIIDATGADYKHMLLSKDWNNLIVKNIEGVPTTVFIDEKGNQVGKTVLGSKSYKDWVKIIDKMLEKVN